MSTSYIPEPGTGAKFRELARLSLKNDGAELVCKIGRHDGWKKVQAREAHNPRAFQYALTDGDNWLHVDFKAGHVDAAERYGGNDVEDLISFCGEMVDEYDSRYYDIVQAEEGEVMPG